MSKFKDRSGTKTARRIVEFAAVLPLMCIALLGGMDLCHREYAQSILTGTVQKIGRDTTLQGGADDVRRQRCQGEGGGAADRTGRAPSLSNDRS